MGASLNVIVQHQLTPSEIVSLDGLVIDPIFDGRKATPVKWENPNINANSLVDGWSKISDHYTENPWAGGDLPILENEEISIFVWTPSLFSITPYFRPSFYRSDELTRNKFNTIVAKFAKTVKATDVIIIEDWYVWEAFDEHIGLTVVEIKKGVIAKNLPYFEIDF